MQVCRNIVDVHGALQSDISSTDSSAPSHLIEKAAPAPVFQYAGSQIMLVPSENRRSLMIEQSADMIHIGSVDDLDRLIDALTAQRKEMRK